MNRKEKQEIMLPKELLDIGAKLNITIEELKAAAYVLNDINLKKVACTNITANQLRCVIDKLEIANE